MGGFVVAFLEVVDGYVLSKTSVGVLRTEGGAFFQISADVNVLRKSRLALYCLGRYVYCLGCVVMAGAV
jgi:hypothetical protein